MDSDLIVDSFVDLGILDMVDNKNNQIVYGRRGTGKTHLLRKVESLQKDDLAIYIDCRKLGSITKNNRQSLLIEEHQFTFFQDIVTQIFNILQDCARDSGSDIHVYEKLDILIDGSLTNPKYDYKPTTVQKTVQNKKDNAAAYNLNPSPQSHLIIDKKKQNGHVEESTSVYEVNEKEDTVIFFEFNNMLTSILNDLDKHLYLLFDEWSSIPIDWQPYYADLLKKFFLQIIWLQSKFQPLSISLSSC